YNVAVGEALERYAGAEAASKYRASRIVPDADVLCRILAVARFRAAHVRPSMTMIRFPQIERFVLSHLSASPVASALAALSAEKRVALAKQVKGSLQPYADGDDVVVPDETNIAIAHT
ncbi:MAG: hypothetical protein ABWY64_17005, partial [Tardiphaga sp.]